MRATISATGKSGSVFPPRSSRSRVRGFTLVELLVVIAILATLFGLVVTMVGQFLGRASEKSTIALILRVQDWVDEYRGLTGYYPADGLDGRLEDDAGAPLRGSAALYYQLGRAVIAEEIYGSRRRLREYPPLGKFGSREVTAEEDEDREYPGVKEIVDGWGTPFHYDNTENGKFRPQDGTVHYPPVADDEHPDDPREGRREIEDTPVVSRPGNQGRGFDLWSHGDHGHDPLAPPNVPIANWNVETFK